MAMDLLAPLRAPLQEVVDAFFHEEVVRVCHQAAELDLDPLNLSYKIARAFNQAEDLELDLMLHQARMEDVCYSIKAHYLWENFEGDEEDDEGLYCWVCDQEISPEIDIGRHRGFCKLMAAEADKHQAHYR